MRPESVLKCVRLWFACTPYTHYHRGIHGAFADAAKVCGEIAEKYKITVLSPICNGHPMATHGPLRACDQAFWDRFNDPLVEASGGGLVVKMKGWIESTGVKKEIRKFKAAKKMVVFVDPETLELSL